MNEASQSEPTREELIALIRAQAAEIAALKERVAELERRLGLNSGNSGKPHSGDGDAGHEQRPQRPAGVRSARAACAAGFRFNKLLQH
jgi:hypothetical protein